MLGTLDVETMRQMERDAPSTGVRLAVGAYRSTFEKKIDEALRILDDLARLGFNDPEGWYLYAFCLAINGASDPALEFATRAVDGGYVCHEALARRPEWTRLDSPRYRALVERTAALAARNQARYVDANGPTILSGAFSQTPKSGSPHNG